MCIFNNQCASDMRKSFWWIISCKDAVSRFSRLWLFARYSTPNLLLITALHLNFCQHWCLSCNQKRQFSSLYFCWQCFSRSFCLTILLSHHHRLQLLSPQALDHLTLSAFDATPIFCHNQLIICQFCWKSNYAPGWFCVKIRWLQLSSSHGKRDRYDSTYIVFPGFAKLFS